MNGAFERNGIYPLCATPLNGFGHDNPTGEYIVTVITTPGKAMKFNAETGEGEVVDVAEATKFGDIVDALRAADRARSIIRSKQQP